MPGHELLLSLILMNPELFAGAVFKFVLTPGELFLALPLSLVLSGKLS